MALSAYFIILMGRKSEKASLIYVVFSTLGSYLMLAGFGLAYKLSGSMSFSGLFNAQNMWVYILVSMGFLIKSGAVGFHIWLPGAYSESDDDFSPIISSVMSKAGVFGLMLVLVYIHNLAIFKINLDAILGWVGIITVFFGTLMSLFQEDMKKLLAYSSMGQLGYIILGLAMYSHMGWVAAIYLAFNHLFFKALLFLAIAGVIYRTNTRNMYELGGLIKNMPISFISVLIGIIALSGVPPLSGFPSKWTLYSALIERGWYYHAGLAFFTSSMAFLYCFRLIHAIFLGQRKLHHKNIKEAPVWFLIPQIVMIIAIMFISIKPQILIKKISDAVSVYLPTTMNFAQNTISSRLGYFNGFAVMLITMITFIIFLVYMLTKTKNMAKVKQFNIVYAGERPDKPETTHFAYDFYAPYKKALGHWAKPKVTEFWKGVSEWLHTIGHTIRTLYTGNAQTYVLHILLLIIISYIIIGGK
jgi:formate hydrogenlyase subunit 3/multisubunit Na+/H+ antiporter MnhD subunit